MSDLNQDWFVSWFDTNYYHLLYKNRDDAEAQNFMLRLIRHLHIPIHSKVLDLACGKGRHSIFLAQNQLQVKGIDLSENSISHAQKFSNEYLEFSVQDMRDSFGSEEFDYIFNLFTSFGYFGTLEEHTKVLKNVFDALKPNGIFVLDYFNVSKAISVLPVHEEKVIENINFSIHKFKENDTIVKSIKILDNGKEFEFFERVKAFDDKILIEIFKNVGFELETKFNNYMLEKDSSDDSRAIYILKKSQS
ncbi:MAG: class I SAM-dependent methyltransferase [Cytophagales bacterium]